MASIVGEMKEVPLFKLGELDAEAMRFLYELGTKNRSYTVQEIDGRMYVNTNDLVRIKEPFPAVLPDCEHLHAERSGGLYPERPGWSAG